MSTKRYKLFSADRLTDLLDRMVHPSVGQNAHVRAAHRLVLGLNLIIGTGAIASALMLTAFDGGAFQFLVPPLLVLSLLLVSAWLTARLGLREIGLHASAGIVLWAGYVASTAHPMFLLLTLLGACGYLANCLLRAPLAHVGAVLLALLPVVFLSGSQILALEAFSISSLTVAGPGLLTAIILGRKFSNHDGISDSASGTGVIWSQIADMVSVHERGGKTIEVAGNSEQILGLEPESLAQSGLLAHLHISHRVHFLNLVNEVIETGEEHSVHVLLRTACGSRRPVEMVARPFLDPSSKDIRVVITTRDNSENVALEADIHELRTRAEEIGESKAKFLSTMSHELRTPLNAILGFSDLLKQGVAGDISESQRDYLSDIHDAGEHLLQIVNDILDVSKMEAGFYELQCEDFDIGLTAKSAVSLVQASLEKPVTINLDLNDDLEACLADRKAVKQIMINLLSNAAKFSHRDGTVKLSVERHYRGVQMTVTDTGVGMSDKDCQAMCEPFTQAQNEYSREANGTGLGLSIVRGFVELHGGSMRIKSRLGHGTKVTVTLPGIDPGELKAKAEIEEVPVVDLSARRATEVASTRSELKSLRA